ncbi:hypothetical protein B0T20DRAFT_430490 [Sordaria brevicollis]|uniref:BTB domain-containing protein n=1 Tax=Sordaria brevicollis TaxID=83679 RepID=A0AAE0PL23_SORBR|nr:hypothetical protein B0T20DRAFT_430490 [Sordaria brevicollis]
MSDDSGVVEVCPTGDIILVVGGEEPLRLRVSSIILRSASKVFDKMFSPPWSESSRQDITLPEDDIEAMKAICYAIHHRPDMIPLDDLTGKHVLQAVRVIDKYDLSTAMKLVTDRWLRHNLRAKSVDDLLYMAAAATILKNYEAFSKLTWLVMILHKGSYLRYQNDDQIRELFPPGMFFLLAERTCWMRSQLSAALQEAEPSEHSKCSCANALRILAKGVREMHGNRSVNGGALHESLREMIELAHAQTYFQGCCCVSGYNHSVTHELSSETLNNKLPDWTYSQTSLCLKCLEGDPNLETNCKHKEKPNGSSLFWNTDAELNWMFTF